MERRPYMLTEHKLQIFRTGLNESLAADPAADEMDEGVNSAEFDRNRLRRGTYRISISKVHH
jgi:hypothetical protein